MNKNRGSIQRQPQLGITILMVASLLFGMAGLSIGTARAEPIDLALNQPAVASSMEGGFVATNAVDGNSGTRWASDWSDPQWLYVDLGVAAEIEHVVITWDPAYASGYEIQVSDDASAWTTIYTTSSGDGSTDDITGLSGSGRYVRMYGTARGTVWGYSIYAFEVYGDLSATRTPTMTATATPLPNLALNQPAVASTEEHGGVLAGNAVDGSLGSRWSSLASDPQWIYVDLGATISIDRVVLKWETAYGSAYEIQVSDDASAWTMIFATASGDGGTDDLSGLSGSGRYVRMYGTARGTPWGYSLYEFQVYASTGSTPEPTATPNETATITLTPTTTEVASATPTPSPTGNACAGANLAIGKTSVASSSENAGTLPGNAVDGNLGSRWASAFTDTEWIYVDLGATATIDCVVLKWEPAYGKQYQIQVSDDASSWTPVFTESNSDGGTDTIPLGSPASNRYVRMQGIQRALPYGFSLYEFEIYGSGIPTVTPVPGCSGTNIALGKSTGASSEAAGLPSGLAVDGNSGTRWASDWTANEWIYVDLGEVAFFDCIRLKWEAAYGKQYEIQASDDLTNWDPLFTETDGNGGTDIIALPSTANNRYVRMLGIERGLPYGYSLYEFEIYGTGGINPTATPTATSLPDLGTNIALNKPAYAWYYQDAAHKPSYAVDGLRTAGVGDTRWASTWNATGWIYVDLGASATIDGVMLFWENAYAVDYQIQTSADAQTWTTVQNVTGNSSTTNVYTFAPAVTGRYVRILCSQRRSFSGFQYGYSLYELEVYGSGDNPGVTPTPTPGPLTGSWSLAWSDEFDGSGNVDANGLNRDNWDYDTQAHFNDESQQYTEAGDNVQVTDGSLKLVALYQPGLYEDYDFTSGRLLSKGKQEFQYGRFEARMKLPVGAGFWPAFWMLGNNIEQVSWPQSGEIDVMENIGYEDWTTGAIHGPGYDGAGSVGDRYDFSGSTVADWHVYKVEWDPTEISWYVDGQIFYTAQRSTLESMRGQWVYDHPFFILLNLAIGGNYPYGNNHVTTPYLGVPQSTVDLIADLPNESHQMEVDWVRVYQRDDFVPPTRTPTATPTATYTPTITNTPPATLTPTASPTATATATELAATPTATRTSTATVTDTITPTLTRTKTLTPTVTPTATRTPVVRTFKSVAARDGWILESSENSNTGGSMNTGANTFQLGDDAGNRQYRVILSFNTASLPEAAIIQSAVLKIRQSGTPTGSNPFNALGSLWADIRKGAFKSATTLQLADFNAPASASAVGAFNKVPVGGWYSDTLNNNGRDNINLGGITQFRLRFSMGDNNNQRADFMKFLSGNAASDKPALVITYILP